MILNQNIKDLEYFEGRFFICHFLPGDCFMKVWHLIFNKFVEHFHISRIESVSKVLTETKAVQVPGLSQSLFLFFCKELRLTSSSAATAACLALCIMRFRSCNFFSKSTNFCFTLSWSVRTLSRFSCALYTILTWQRCVYCCDWLLSPVHDKIF